MLLRWPKCVRSEHATMRVMRFKNSQHQMAETLQYIDCRHTWLSVSRKGRTLTFSLETHSWSAFDRNCLETNSWKQIANVQWDTCIDVQMSSIVTVSELSSYNVIVFLAYSGWWEAAKILGKRQGFGLRGKRLRIVMFNDLAQRRFLGQRLR